MSGRTTSVELPRGELERVQLERLRALVVRVARAPLDSERLAAARVRPDEIRSLEDLRRLPFTKADFRDTYPFGLLVVPMDQIVRIHASSGTTGKATVVGYACGALDVWTEGMRRTTVGLGFSFSTREVYRPPSDRVRSPKREGFCSEEYEPAS